MVASYTQDGNCPLSLFSANRRDRESGSHSSHKVLFAARTPILYLKPDYLQKVDGGRIVVSLAEYPPCDPGPIKGKAFELTLPINKRGDGPFLSTGSIVLWEVNISGI